MKMELPDPRPRWSDTCLREMVSGEEREEERENKSEERKEREEEEMEKEEERGRRRGRKGLSVFPAWILRTRPFPAHTLLYPKQQL